MVFQEVWPKESEKYVSPEGIDYLIEYYTYDMVFLEILIQKSKYCTQEIFLDCNDASLELGETLEYGWYNRKMILQRYWPGNVKGMYRYLCCIMYAILMGETWNKDSKIAFGNKVNTKEQKSETRFI